MIMIHKPIMKLGFGLGIMLQHRISWEVSYLFIFFRLVSCD